MVFASLFPLFPPVQMTTSFPHAESITPIRFVGICNYWRLLRLQSALLSAVCDPQVAKGQQTGSANQYWQRNIRKNVDLTFGNDALCLPLNTPASKTLVMPPKKATFRMHRKGKAARETACASGRRWECSFHSISGYLKADFPNTVKTNRSRGAMLRQPGTARACPKAMSQSCRKTLSK
jgi:hypothetical protein